MLTASDLDGGIPIVNFVLFTIVTMLFTMAIIAIVHFTIGLGIWKPLF